MEKEIKVGSIVALKSNPEIRLTVTGVSQMNYHLILQFYNNSKGCFEQIKAPKEALILIE